MSKEVSGKLSNRVMNMKFMRQAEHAEEEAKEEQKVRQLVDSSEWTLAGRDKIATKLRSQPSTISHTGLRGEGQHEASVGRRKFGQKPVPQSEKPSQETLDDLWEAQKQQQSDKSSKRKRGSEELEPEKRQKGTKNARNEQERKPELKGEREPAVGSKNTNQNTRTYDITEC